MLADSDRSWELKIAINDGSKNISVFSATETVMASSGALICAIWMCNNDKNICLQNRADDLEEYLSALRKTPQWESKRLAIYV